MMLMNESPANPERSFVSRAGLKLDHALNEFDFDVSGLICADFGCNVGGFTDCLLKRGAAKVYAIDTGYGSLDYTLRIDKRVVVMERTNALHATPPVDAHVELVVIDLAWTKQRHAIPAALRWLGAPGQHHRRSIITLVKPHYELDEHEKTELLHDGALAPEHARRVLNRVLSEMPNWGAKPMRWTPSPLIGGKSGRGRKHHSTTQGNVEFLVLAEPL